MKKLSILALALILAASLLTACRNPVNNESGDTSTSTVNPTTKPTEAPTTKPTTKPTEAPTTKPTEAPTTKPTESTGNTDATKDNRGRAMMPHF